MHRFAACPSSESPCCCILAGVHAYQDRPLLAKATERRTEHPTSHSPQACGTQRLTTTRKTKTSSLSMTTPKCCERRLPSLVCVCMCLYRVQHKRGPGRGGESSAARPCASGASVAPHARPALSLSRSLSLHAMHEYGEFDRCDGPPARARLAARGG